VAVIVIVKPQSPDLTKEIEVEPGIKPGEKGVAVAPVLGLGEVADEASQELSTQAGAGWEAPEKRPVQTSEAWKPEGERLYRRAAGARPDGGDPVAGDVLPRHRLRSLSRQALAGDSDDRPRPGM
jgi:hypothetical protein